MGPLHGVLSLLPPTWYVRMLGGNGEEEVYRTRLCNSIPLPFSAVQFNRRIVPAGSMLGSGRHCSGDCLLMRLYTQYPPPVCYTQCPPRLYAVSSSALRLFGLAPVGSAPSAFEL